MLRQTLIAVLVVAAAVVLGSAAPQIPGKRNTPSTEEADFTGKVLEVRGKSGGNNVVMQKARIKRLAGRAFLGGESVKRSGDEGSPLKTCWLPVEDLTLIREFKSAEDFEKEQAANERKRNYCIQPF
jgi:hypothetical protein